ncbi:MAG TPA: acetolactate synthase [Actinomycetota bacterium]|nr:acetolactate synthase [Actinomycetota bacterium]
MAEHLHAGYAVSRALKALGVEQIFTLSGGHIFPIFDACHNDGIRIVDVRHEQSAGFAAEGWARLTRRVGVAVVTAGPGVTNVMSPIAQAGFNGAPMLVLAGRAPQFRWGKGSLQEIDHVPFLAPLAEARTVMDPAAIVDAVVAAARGASSPPRRPAFLDFPLDVMFSTTDVEVGEVPPVETPEPDGSAVEEIARLLAEARRPVLIGGSNVWLDGADAALRELVEAAELPVFLNGQGRGCVPADHRLAFSRARSRALADADLVIVAGTPLDFRLGFGEGFGQATKVVHLDSDPSLISQVIPLAAGAGAPLDKTFAALTAAVDAPGDTKDWVELLRGEEEKRRAAAQADLSSTQTPIHPMRVYGELAKVLDRDAIVVGDGGDFVSYAGREVPSYEGGAWLDPGPFGCLGCGPGYALAARLAHPDRQVCLLYGDGALGFSGTELETFVRHGLPVVAVVGNNGIWALEKHPMRAMYGYDVAADLRPGIRYDRMMEAFGGRGELVDDPEEVGPALRRAFESGEPSLVNILTDPEVAYPRSSNLA